MKIMIGIILLVNSLAAFSFQDTKISGVVVVPNELKKTLAPSGVLYVFAKNVRPGQPPVAVVKISNPKFPQVFSISAQDVMMGAKFEGPMHIMARYSPNGNPIKSPDSLEGTDAQNPSVAVGTKNIKINLNKDKSSNGKDNKIPMH
jgi:hypothetical protein